MATNDLHNSYPHGLEPLPHKKCKRDRKTLILREGTIGGKLPWLSWKNGRTWRHISQAVFMFINAYIGVTFYLWVRHYETVGQSVYVQRPSGIEGWLPIAGLMNLKFSLLTQRLPPIYTASMLLLTAFIIISAAFKKSFCSWICPIGTLSEALWRLGANIFKARLSLNRWIDIPLRSIKYLLLATIVYFLIPLPPNEIASFLTTPYGIIIDVKMLDLFRHIGQTTLTILTILTVSSLFVQNAWCRYFCPYGALMGLASVFSPFKIRRDPDACIDCNRCTRACPSRLPVAHLLQVRSIECTTCMSCVEICPAKDALQLSLRPKKYRAANGEEQRINVRWKGKKVLGLSVAMTICITLTLIIGYAKYTQRWDSPVPEQLYKRFIPNAKQFGHP